MKAAWYEKTGPAAEVIRVGEIDDPVAGPGEVVVAVEVHGDDPGATNRAGDLNHQQTDHACADHHGGGSRLGVDQTNGMQGDRKGLGKGRLLEGKMVGEGDQNRSGHGDKTGKGSVLAELGAGDAEDLPAFAEIRMPTRAVGTTTTEEHRVHGHAIADGPTGGSLSEGRDGPRTFVPHDDRGQAATGIPIIAMDVAAADPAGGDLNQNFSRNGHWLRDIRDGKFLVFGQDKGFHG